MESAKTRFVNLVESLGSRESFERFYEFATEYLEQAHKAWTQEEEEKEDATEEDNSLPEDTLHLIVQSTLVQQ
jgi:hypothetical protein